MAKATTNRMTPSNPTARDGTYLCGSNQLYLLYTTTSHLLTHR